MPALLIDSCPVCWAALPRGRSFQPWPHPLPVQLVTRRGDLEAQFVQDLPSYWCAAMNHDVIVGDGWLLVLPRPTKRDPRLRHSVWMEARPQEGWQFQISRVEAEESWHVALTPPQMQAMDLRLTDEWLNTRVGPAMPENARGIIEQHASHRLAHSRRV